MLSLGRQGQAGEESTPRVLSILSKVIEKLVGRNEKVVDGMKSGTLGKSLNSFHGVRAPNISIPKYLERIYKYTNCSPSCLVVGYVYIDRLVHKHPDSLVLSFNVHRLLLTTVLVASKMLDDVHYNNALYARVGGVTNAELNKLEIELLFLLDFGVMVSCGIFESYCLHLEKEGAFHNIHRSIPSASLHDVADISQQYTQTSSPPQPFD
ncbi:cyclin-U1-1 [Euphorbia lathyris]|uniref:cyclin-U1-1 n=1 Tax=Euphorbia lathyris TaxID=212925 RepID=UPI00331424C4